MNSDELAKVASVLDAVGRERARQHDRWGVQRLDWPVWLAVLTEEVGVSAQAALEIHIDPTASLDHLREELVQVAAVAVAIIEHIDEVQRDEASPAEVSA